MDRLERSRENGPATRQGKPNPQTVGGTDRATTETRGASHQEAIPMLVAVPENASPEEMLDAAAILIAAAGRGARALEFRATQRPGEDEVDYSLKVEGPVDPDPTASS